MTPGLDPDDTPRDTPRDEHLRAALRHAPDAQLQPPAHLRAQIVAAAHRAVSEPAPVAAPRPRRWWSPGPLGASGAFASVLLAGFIGLMWGESPPGPQVDTPEPAPALSPVPAPAPAPAPASARAWASAWASADTCTPGVAHPGFTTAGYPDHTGCASHHPAAQAAA